MQTCLVCGTQNAADAVQCSNCQQPLPAADSVDGPLAGAAAYPGAPEAEQYGAQGYQLATQLEHQRSAPRLTPGTVIGHDRYRIRKIVALGGMGAVYEADDQNLHRPCAVKEMLDTYTEPKEREQAVEWFKREASMLHDLNHPAIPRVRDSFQDAGRYYLVMDFVNGRNLAEVLEREGPQGLAEARVRNWALQLCDVLSYLHHQGVIFRDLKPANVMVGPDERVKLIDFGIARSLRAQNESTVIVTFGFAAPEQLQGHPEQRSDIYSLGATLHRLLTHHDPANNKPMVFDFPLIHNIRPDITPAFEHIIMRALSPRAADRWPTAGEMGRALRGIAPLSANPQPIPMANLGPNTTRTPSRSLQAFDDLIIQARASLEQGRWQEAQKFARRAIDADRQHPQGHKMLGIVYARSRPPEVQRALAEYQEALRLEPNDSETRRLIGDVYLFLMQKPAEAMAEYNRSLQLKPTDFETHRLLGMCLEQTNRLEDARMHYAEAVRLAPHYVPAHMSYGQLALRLARLTDAELAFVEALRLNPGLPIARHLLAQVYERQGRMSEALREAEYSVQVDPRDTGAQATLQRLRKMARANKHNTRPRSL